MKIVVDHAVAVEVYFPAVQIFKKAVIFLFEDLGHKGIGFLFRMSFGLASLLFHQFFELPLESVERIPQYGGKLVVDVPLRRLPPGNHLVSGRNFKVDADAKRLAGSLVLMWAFHRQPATDNVIAKAFKFGGLLPDQVF
jgi:hypothetical protein